MKLFLLTISIFLSATAFAEIDPGYDDRPDFPFFDARINISRCGSEQGRAGIYNPRIVRACMGTEKGSGRRILMIRNGTSPIYYYLLHGHLPQEGISQTMVKRFISAFVLEPNTLTQTNRREPFFFTFTSTANELGKFDNIHFSGKTPDDFLPHLN